ncbi:MAG: dicarboxylate/amino acid:cation symporter [Bacteroidetes bacterium]|nr:MAG: dicarboxylate/amino acid:cation symporter [Bacteroidota bacterium]
MKKIALHWQILAALIAAIIYGVVFNTNYEVRDLSINRLKIEHVDAQVISQYEQLRGQTYKTKAALKEALEGQIQIDYSKYERQLIAAAYYNPAVKYVSWMGDIFMRALKMLIIPLVLSSLISGVSNLGGGDNLGRLGMKTLAYYMLTSTFAIVTGLFFVNLIKPGVGADTSSEGMVDGLSKSADSIGQTLIEIVPTNLFESLSRGDMLPIIFFAILFGFFITKVGNKPRIIMTDFFNSLFDIMMKVTMWIIRFTPLGVFGIVAKVIADQDDLIGLAARMGLYMITVLLGLSFHAFITLPLLTRFIGKVNPVKHFKAVTTPLLTAFSTSSSGATLPLTMTAVEQNDGVSNKVTSFTLPLGATVNMDGTALYELVVAVFIAQAYGIDLSIGQQMIMVLTALLASIGAAAIPMAGMVMITVVLTVAGLPLEGIGLVLAVDRILDMFRTSVNVWSDTCGAVIIAKSEGENLKV